MQEFTPRIASAAVQIVIEKELAPPAALLLAAAVELSRSRPELEIIVLSSDARLNAAAAADGIAVENPEQ